MGHQANPCHVEGQCACMLIDFLVIIPGYVTQPMITKLDYKASGFSAF